MEENGQEKHVEKKASNPVTGFIVIAVVSIFASSFLTAKMMAPPAGAAQKAAHGGAEKGAAQAEHFEILKLGEFVVNLANKETTRYLKADISVEKVKAEAEGKKEKEKEKGHGAAAAGGLGEDEAMVRDLIINALSSHTSQELGSQEGKKMLKDEIMAALNANVKGMKAVKIYFNSFMMQ